MAFIRIIIFSVFTLATACTVSNADSTWHGEYHYAASGGETVGGSQITMNITLIIGKQNGIDKCILKADGYQTYDRILCTTTISNNSLNLLFKSYEDGSTVNEIGVERYKIGETLFSLDHVTDQSIKNRYIAHWAAYSPFNDERNNAKDYFEKQNVASK